MKEKENRKSMIKIRGGFSDRNGFCPVCNAIQIDEFDDRTRMVLANTIFRVVDMVFHYSKASDYLFARDGIKYLFLLDVLTNIFGEEGYKCSAIKWEAVFDKVTTVVKQAPINEVLDIVEYIISLLVVELHTEDESKKQEQGYAIYDESQNDDISTAFYVYFNGVFERECVGYRFVNGIIIKNIDDTEIEAIEEAGNTMYDSCNAHIKKATHFLYDRTNPDYKNSVKESICAVESICKAIVGNKNADLAGAIKKLKDNGLQIHPALEQAFSKLYAYTSDKGGIRHADGMFESNVTFEEAKFMLVSCCAFVNYLVAEHGKLGGRND